MTNHLKKLWLSTINNFDRIYFILLIILIIFGASILTAFLKNGGSIHENIYPELIGFSLEGIFFVIIFTIYEKRKNKLQIINHKKNLKQNLRFLLAIIIQWSQPIKSKVEFQDLFLDIDSIKKLRDELEKTNRVDGVQADFLRLHAAARIPSIQSAIPVAAELGGLHLLFWDSILNNLSAIAKSEKDEDTYEILLEFIKYLIAFDDAEITI